MAIHAMLKMQYNHLSIAFVPLQKKKKKYLAASACAHELPHYFQAWLTW